MTGWNISGDKYKYQQLCIVVKHLYDSQLMLEHYCDALFEHLAGGYWNLEWVIPTFLSYRE